MLPGICSEPKTSLSFGPSVTFDKRLMTLFSKIGATLCSSHNGIVEVFPGSYGLVCGVQVRTAHGTVRWPLKNMVFAGGLWMQRVVRPPYRPGGAHSTLLGYVAQGGGVYSHTRVTVGLPDTYPHTLRVNTGPGSTLTHVTENRGCVSSAPGYRTM